MRTRATLLASLLMLLSGNNFATILTVSNHPLGGAQYSTLQAAKDAASNGDTLLIEGTSIAYNLSGCSAFDESLVFIGSGINTQKDKFIRTQITTDCWGQWDIRITAGDMKFYGINFVSEVKFHAMVSNILFEDCLLNTMNYNGNAATNIVFRNCIFDRDNNYNLFLPAGNASSTVITNCVFDGLIDGGNNFNTTLNIDHCIFLRTDGVPLQSVKGATIANCVFMNYATISDAGTTGCTFLNNIARLNAVLPPAGNSGSANITNADPSFMVYTAGSFYSASHDYHLQSASPGIAAGSDSTDIGIHGGLSGFNELGEVKVAPVIRVMQINNTSVAPNGTVNVHLEASKPISN